MPTVKINFFAQLVTLPVKNRREVRKCLNYLISQEKHPKFSGEINLIFCDDNFLSTLNSKYLKHKSLTDIITFDYSTEMELLGDIYISSERVRENSKIYSQPYFMEILRVMIHGFLHLCGYKDKKLEEKELMTKKENQYIAIFEEFVKESNVKNIKGG